MSSFSGTGCSSTASKRPKDSQACTKAACSRLNCRGICVPRIARYCVRGTTAYPSCWNPSHNGSRAISGTYSSPVVAGKLVWPMLQVFVSEEKVGAVTTLSKEGLTCAISVSLFPRNPMEKE